MSLRFDRYGRNRFGKVFCNWLCHNYIGDSYGNGCAMRVSPIANYFNDLNDIIRETMDSTRPSHNNSDSYIASEAVSLCIYLAKNKKPKKKIKEILSSYYNLDFDLEDLRSNYKFTSKASNSVPQAIFCFLESKDFEDAIRTAISIGGDSDTIAAITGSIAEVYYGIPINLIKEVEKYLPEYIINITNDFYSAIGKDKPFKSKLKEFFKDQNLYTEEFFDFMKSRVKKLPSGTSLEWFGCFPFLEDGKLSDIKLLVPEIKNEQDLLVNIHEYYHAYELYNELGTIYKENRIEREEKASNFEKIYKKNKPI